MPFCFLPPCDSQIFQSSFPAGVKQQQLMSACAPKVPSNLGYDSTNEAQTRKFIQSHKAPNSLHWSGACYMTENINYLQYWESQTPPGQGQEKHSPIPTHCDLKQAFLFLRFLHISSSRRPCTPCLESSLASSVWLTDRILKTWTKDAKRALCDIHYMKVLGQSQNFIFCSCCQTHLPTTRPSSMFWGWQKNKLMFCLDYSRRWK